MSYAVKEIFYTLQGEGALTGRPAVFCRFAGCNLWSGREEDRAGAVCTFCDTDFVGTDGTNGGRYADAEMLADAVAASWPAGEADQFVVCTGGEPLLQLDPPLIAALHERGFEIAIETNGTIMPPGGIDWICVSPKRRSSSPRARAESGRSAGWARPARLCRARLSSLLGAADGWP
jgi:7-carboxy-7-deazaguanine synthase (Cx14CxxC type)